MYRLTERDLVNGTGSTIIEDFNNRDMDSTSQRFQVTITETLKRTVEVEAGDQHEAEQIASADWRLGGYILDESDFTEVAFEAVPVIEESEEYLDETVHFQSGDDEN